MNKNLKNILKNIIEQDGNNDLWSMTTIAAKKILHGRYKGRREDIKALEECKIENGFDFEELISRGTWFWRNTIDI
jgi:hypothetical protein